MWGGTRERQTDREETVIDNVAKERSQIREEKREKKTRLERQFERREADRE